MLKLIMNRTLLAYLVVCSYLYGKMLGVTVSFILIKYFSFPHFRHDSGDSLDDNLPQEQRGDPRNHIVQIPDLAKATSRKSGLVLHT